MGVNPCQAETNFGIAKINATFLKNNWEIIW